MSDKFSRPASQETKFNLSKIIGQKIEETTISIDAVVQQLNNLENIEKTYYANSLGSLEDTVINHIKKVAEYRLLVGFIMLDIFTSIRVYLKSECNYEIVYASKQIVVVINEGYKKIYNFIGADGKLSNRHRSFWVKYIGKVVNIDNSLKDEYDSLTLLLESYLENNFQNIKEYRDMAVHYDDNLLKVYSMYLNLDIDSIVKIVIPFNDILYKMFQFTHKLMNQLNEYTQVQHDKSLQEHLSKLQSLKDQAQNDEMKKIIDDMKQQIIKLYNL